MAPSYASIRVRGTVRVRGRVRGRVMGRVMVRVKVRVKARVTLETLKSNLRSADVFEVGTSKPVLAEAQAPVLQLQGLVSLTIPVLRSVGGRQKAKVSSVYSRRSPW